MKEKLKELRSQEARVRSELRSITDEIEKLEKQVLDSDCGLYEGKWFYKEEDWWDEYDGQYPSYEIVYVKKVVKGFSSNWLEALIITFNSYWKLQNFNIGVDETFSIKDLEGMKEMTECEFADMDETIKQTLECLLEIRPELKEKFTFN